MNSGVSACLAVFGQRLRVPVEGADGTCSVSRMPIQIDTVATPVSVEVDRHVGGQLVDARLLRTVGRPVHVADRSR